MKKQLLILVSIVFLLPMFLSAQVDLKVEKSVDREIVSASNMTKNATPKSTVLNVSDVAGLVDLKNYLNQTDVVVYIENDIDLSSISNWTPIGAKNSPFEGTIYGQSYTISNLTINSNKNDRGLFGYFDGQVENLHLVNVNISGKNRVGGFSANGNGASIYKVTVDGVISGNNKVGGICGYSYKPVYIADCYANVEMNVTGSNAGGITGWVNINENTNYYEVHYSYSFGVINASQASINIGGVVGYAENAYLAYNYSNMNIKGKSNVGSVVGKFIRSNGWFGSGVCYYGIGSGEVMNNISTNNSTNFAKIIGYTDHKYSFQWDNSCYTRTDMKYQKNGANQNEFPEINSNYNGISQSPDAFDVSFYEGLGWDLARAESDLGEELYSIFIYTPKDTEWDGEENKAWSNAANWTNGVPNVNSSVMIPNVGKADVEVEIVSDDACKSLTIGESVSIVVKPGYTLKVSGTISNNNPESSEFVLQSDANSAGSLIHNSGSISVRYEQYIPENGAMIGSPVDLPTNVTFSDIQTASGQSNMGIDIMNDMFMSWDENEVVNGYTGIWTDLLTPVNGVYPMTTESFEQGKGLFISYRNRNETIVFEGVARPDNEYVSTTYTSSSSNPGANFISNPFVANVASNNQTNNSHNFLKDNMSHLQDGSAALYIWDPQTSTYSVVNNISGGDYRVKPGQSFLVKTKENANLSFNKNTRIESANGKNLKALKESRISIAVNNSTNNGDVTDIYFSENMTVGVDKGYDAEKIMNDYVNIFTNLPESNDERFAVLALPTSYNALTIPVQMDVLEAGRHTLTFAITNVNANTVYLKDNETGEMTNLNLVTEVKVDLEAGLTEGRFELFIKDRASISSSSQEGQNLKGTITNINQDMIISLEEIIDGNVDVYNLSGQSVYSGEINGEKNKTFNTNLSTGYYVVKVQNNQGEILTEKVFIK